MKFQINSELYYRYYAQERHNRSLTRKLQSKISNDDQSTEHAVKWPRQSPKESKLQLHEKKFDAREIFYEIYLNIRTFQNSNSYLIFCSRVLYPVLEWVEGDSNHTLRLVL